MGKPVQSMILSLLRDFILCVPLILIFPMFVEPGVMGPLYSAPIADVVTLLVAGVMMASVLKKLNQMEESHNLILKSVETA